LKIDLHSPNRASDCLDRLHGRFEQPSQGWNNGSTGGESQAESQIRFRAKFNLYAVEIGAASRADSASATFKGVVREDEAGGSWITGQIALYPPDWFRRAVYGLLAVMIVGVGAAALNGENTLPGCVLAAAILGLVFLNARQSFPRDRARSEAVAGALAAALSQAVA
jgi:hypothetical protein